MNLHFSKFAVFKLKLAIGAAVALFSLTASANFSGEIGNKPKNINGAVPGTDTFFDIPVPLSGKHSNSIAYSTGPITDASGATASPGVGLATMEADLRLGLFKVYAKSNLPKQVSGIPVGEIESISNFRYSDLLTVISNGNPGAFVSFQLRVTGASTTYAGGFYEEVAQLHIRTDQGGVTQRADAYVNNSCNFSGCGSRFSSSTPESFASAVAGFQFGAADIITVRIPIVQLTTTLQFELDLDDSATNAEVDFSHTATLSMVASTGVTVQNSTGNFLTPVPEPSTMVLFMLGFICLTFTVYRNIQLRKAPPRLSE